MEAALTTRSSRVWACRIGSSRGRGVILWPMTPPVMPLRGHIREAVAAAAAVAVGVMRRQPTLGQHAGQCRAASGRAIINEVWTHEEVLVTWTVVG